MILKVFPIAMLFCSCIPVVPTDEVVSLLASLHLILILLSSREGGQMFTSSCWQRNTAGFKLDDATACVKQPFEQMLL